MRIAVLGVGLIGGSIGLAAREHIDAAEVVGHGRSRERLDHAVEKGAITRGTTSVEEALEGADACFCCAPVGALADQVAAALAAAPPGCVVTDVGSVKRGLAGAFEDERFVGGHPIAGAETAGVEHARADLFQGAVWYLTPTETSSGILYERLFALVRGLGAGPVAIDPEAHDRMLAGVSHLPHVVANALVTLLAGQRQGEGGALSRIGPSFRDATRVAGANPAIWTDIFMANREQVLDQVRELGAELAEVEKLLDAGDRDAVSAWIERVRAERAGLVETHLAAGDVHELRLTVPNRPGIVAEVALALGNAGLNIADMALAPAADMRTGAISLWIAGEEQAGGARRLIEGLGFPVAEA